jgi:hypothetical protein
VVSSVAEAEFGALFVNAKEGNVTHTTLAEMGHNQDATELKTDNSTATLVTADSQDLRVMLKLRIHSNLISVSTHLRVLRQEDDNGRINPKRELMLAVCTTMRITGECKS